MPAYDVPLPRWWLHEGGHSPLPPGCRVDIDQPQQLPNGQWLCATSAHVTLLEEAQEPWYFEFRMTVAKGAEAEAETTAVATFALFPGEPTPSQPASIAVPLTVTTTGQSGAILTISGRITARSACSRYQDGASNQLTFAIP